MIKIIGLFPLEGNGGIASWTKKYLKTFPDANYRLIPISNSPIDRKGKNNIIIRAFTGIRALKRMLNEIRQAIKIDNPDILHTTTSGSYGAFRDIVVGRLCRKKGVKSVLHCRYGCIKEDVSSKSLIGFLTRKAFTLFDQIWVLDRASYDFLKSDNRFVDKVCLTPNSIEVSENLDRMPKTFERVAFIGNLIETKGILELTEACTKCNVRLDIIGPGDLIIMGKIKDIAGEKLNKTIFIHGKLSNDKAVQFMKQVDMLALPTYYPWEAFPISILEAMSLTKLVISCRRAAIPDMLTGLDGKACGILVEPKSAKEIERSIKWAQSNQDEANEICRKAYEKVSTSYSIDKIYELYKQNYSKLLKK